MPELPEVEHNRRNLTRWMRGARLEHVHVYDAWILRPSAAISFKRKLTGAQVRAVERKGKWLRLALDNGHKLFMHLGMTGWFEHAANGGDGLRFERIGFDLEHRRKRSHVAFVDPRRWGRLIVSAADTPTWRALGPDPLSDGIDPAALHARLARSKTRSVKEALLDQKVLAGVGNIQAIEALWKAKIDPRSRASALGLWHVKALERGLHWTIERTLADLAKGHASAKNPFKVYGRKGEPCPRCSHPFQRIELGGRTTTFCANCQVRLP